MSFKPGADDSGNRQPKEQQIEGYLYDLGSKAHPATYRRSIRSGIDKPPEYANHNKRENR
jgi:hypothetical protein